MKAMTMFTAQVAGQQNNAHYPHRHDVTTSTDLEAVVQLDHVVAEYVHGRRSAGSFVTSNCLVMDVDNSHTEEAAEWVTPESLAEQLPDVAFMTATSRNHQRAKGAQSARPRFHVYFPINPVTDAEAYAGLKKQLAARFEFFDPNVIDAGRFIYGHNAPRITVVEGEGTIDAWLADAADEDVFAQWDEATQAIEEGSRNATLSRFAGRLLIRLGTTDEARALFDRKAARCNPPLPEVEVESIWRSATRFAKMVEDQPGYVPPSDFEASLNSIRPADYSDVGQAHALTKAYPDALRYSEATDWLVYYDGVWYESAPAAQAVAQELTERQLAEAHELLEDAKDQLAATGAAMLLASMSKAKAQAMFNAAQQEAFAAFEDAKTYAAYALKRRESRRITNCLKEARPMLLTTPKQLDADPYLLNTPSGTYDLRVGQASKRDHDPEDLLTKQTSLDPSNEGAEIWAEALDVFFQGDTELIDYVQRIVGLAAIGQVFVEALVIAYGDGRNGKSTFWNTIAIVFGTYAGNMSADVLTIGGMRNVKPELAEAKGKRLIISAESEEGVRMSTSVVKQLASGAIYDEHGDVIEVHDRKLDALEDLVEAANGQPLLVAYWFKHDRERITERLPQARELTTSTDIKAWNAREIPLALIHPASAGHGLNLQQGGNLLVWFSLTWSLELYQQTNARLYRQGQDQPVTITHLAAVDTLDQSVLAALDNKDTTQAALINAVADTLGKQAHS